MIKTIWKYTLNSDYDIKMPAGATVLSVQIQRGEICLWALVDPYALTELRRFRIYGTGLKVPDHGNLKFIGTVQDDAEFFVLHVFEIIAQKQEEQQ